MDKYQASELKQIAQRKLDIHIMGCNQKNPYGCEACALTLGYDEGPMTDKWAKVYVEAERVIPSEWRNAFIDELISEDLDYRHALEDSIKWFGVRYQE